MWSLHAVGTVAEVRAQVEQAEDQWHSTQFDAAKRYVLGELADWPSEYAKVEAHGHNDSRTRNATIKLTQPVMYRAPAEKDSAA